jgi:hypothetical protein
LDGEGSKGEAKRPISAIAPSGGLKESGIARDRSKYGIEFFPAVFRPFASLPPPDGAAGPAVPTFVAAASRSIPATSASNAGGPSMTGIRSAVRDAAFAGDLILIARALGYHRVGRRCLNLR